MVYLQCSDCGVIFARHGASSTGVCAECDGAAVMVDLVALGATPADVGDNRVIAAEPTEPSWAEHYEDTPLGYLYADGSEWDY